MAWHPSFSFGDPGIPGGSSGGSGFDWGSVFDAGVTAAQIWTNYDLAKRAENAQRPTTFQTGINGTPIVTGGGALNLGLSGQNSLFPQSFGGSSLILIVVFVVLIIFLVLKR